MAESDNNLRSLLDHTAVEKTFLERDNHAENAEQNAAGTAPATSPAVSLMITNRQRAALRELGYAEEAIRQMTPAEAHEKLGLVEPF